MEFACSIQAVDMIEEILNTEGVFKETKYNGDVKYWVQNLVPDTRPVSGTFKMNKVDPSEQEEKVENCFASVNAFPFTDSLENYLDDESCDENDDDDDDADKNGCEKTEENFVPVVNLRCKSATSFLRLLIESSTCEETDTRIAQLLIKEPFRSLTQNYCSKYREFHVYLFFLHLLYMILATIFLTPTSETWPNEYVSFQNICFATNSSDIPIYHVDSSIENLLFSLYGSFGLYSSSVWKL